MTRFQTNGTIVILVAAVMLAVAVVVPCDAQIIKTNVTQFYLYAQGADEWVRTHTAYALAPMRAADGISKSQATRYVLEDGYNDRNIILNPASSDVFNLRAVGVPHPYCAPASPGGKWANRTLFCNSDTSYMRWLRLVSAQGSVNPLIAGLTVYLQDTTSGFYCSSHPWPTNEAALVCDSFSMQVAQRFNVEI